MYSIRLAKMYGFDTKRAPPLNPALFLKQTCPFFCGDPALFGFRGALFSMATLPFLV